MTLDEYGRRLDQVTVDMNTEPMGTLMIQLGNSALRTLRKRIQETGIDSHGAKYAPYSTRPSLTNCSAMTTSACSRIAGSKAKRRELEWVTLKRGDRNIRLFVLPQGYKQFRELHGRQTAFVDFTFSGQMWRDIALVSDFSEHTKGHVRIGAKRKEDQDKLAGNTQRKGDILALSDKEVSELADSYGIGIQQLFIKNGL